MNSLNNIKVGSPLGFKSSIELESPFKMETSPSLLSRNSSSKDEPIDRFIPNRVAMNLNNVFFNEDLMNNSDKNPKNSSEISKEDQNIKIYSNLLQTQILGEKNLNIANQKCDTHSHENPNKKNFVRFKSDKKTTDRENCNPSYYSPLTLNFSDNHLFNPITREPPRKIAKLPYKVLDAPSLQDDFYLNLLDWSSLNFISIGLENAVYIWSACNSKVNKLCELPDNNLICSLAWSPQGNHLSVGNSDGQIQIYDINKNKLLKTIDAHNGRVGSLAWNGYLLGSGSRDRSVMVRDLRDPNNVVSTFVGHKQEICGLRWSFDEQFLSSGGNDNKLFIWSLKSGGEMARFSQHNAAVKALGWSPHQYNILASGGGTADRTIRYWNMHTLSQQDCIDTGSQVCNLMFSKTSNEIISTHGYSLNQIIVWKYPSLKKVTTLTGHTSRVLYLSMSPCGQNVVTGAGDETLRFWNLFPNNKIKEIGGINASGLYANADLR